MVTKSAIPDRLCYRKFGDKQYSLFAWYPSRAEAENVAVKKRSAGIRARVTKRYWRYLVWIRKK